MNHINYSPDYSYPGLLTAPECTAVLCYVISDSLGCGRGKCGVSGAQPDDPTVALPEGDPHVGLHVLLLVPGGQPRGERRQAGQGAGLPPARRPVHSSHQHPGVPQVRKQEVNQAQKGSYSIFWERTQSQFEALFIVKLYLSIGNLDRNGTRIFRFYLLTTLFW